MNILSTIKKIINGVDIDSLKSKIAELESNLRRIKDDNARKVTEIASLEKKNETLNEDLIREQNKVCIAENKQREFAIKLSELEKKTTSLESLNGTLLETQKSLSKDNISLKAKITRWDNKISSLQEEKDQLTGIITKLQEESSILTQKNEEFKKALEESENVNLNNVAEIGRLKTEIVLKNDELENEKAEKKSTSQKLYELNFLYSNLQKNTLEEKEILLNRISESVNRCKKLEEDNATLREIKSNQIDKILLYESEKRDLDERITNLEKENSDISTKLKESENEVSKLVTNTETLQENERNYISKVEKLKSQLKEALDKIIELSSIENTPIIIDKTNDDDIGSEEDSTNSSVNAIGISEENHEDVSETLDDSEDIVSEGDNTDSSVDATGISEEDHEGVSETPDDSEDIVSEVDNTDSSVDATRISEENHEDVPETPDDSEDIVSEGDNTDSSVDATRIGEEDHEGVSETPDDSENIVSERDNTDSSVDATRICEENQEDVSETLDDSEDIVSEGDNTDNSVDATGISEENHEDVSETLDDSEDIVSEGDNTDSSVDATRICEEDHGGVSGTPDESEDDVLKDDSLPLVYDYGLIPAEKLSIPEVYDIREEKIINSRDFFSQNENELILWRRNLQEEYLMGQARFICPECKQPVKISGHKLFRGRVCYFAHFKDSDDCPYKTGTNRTKEEIERLKYSLVQESERHKRLKSVIASALQGDKSKAMGVDNVECEKRINSDIPYLKWRKPDVYAEYNGRKYVFELQLSTTFVSVIVDRDIFYRLNDYNIIWIFNFEDNEEYVNLYNLMCKDIYYANKRNVFIFDADAEEKSKEKGELVLKCRWLDEDGVWSHDKYVTLEMFQYDEEYHKPFIFDADKAYLEKYPWVVERRKQLENSREYLLKALMERLKHEEELEKKKDEERANLQLELLNTDKCVERFRSGTKYGYQYEGTTILPAKYTSAEAIGKNGYAQVGFNRKIGLVRKDGKELVPVEYRKIDVINHQHGIVIAQYKRLDLWLGDEHFTLRNEFDDKEQTVIKEEENGKTNFILQTNTYNYSYSQSYYGDHPICHKNFSGHLKSKLFSFVEEKDYCIIWVDEATYLLSRNHISSVKGSYSEIVSIGVDQLFIAKENNTKLWGVIDLHGNAVTEFRYAKLIPTESKYLIAKYFNDSLNYGVVDYQGREFIEPQYESLIYLNSERFAFRKDNLWGICDRMGKVIHGAEYTYIRGIDSGELRASTLDSYLTKWKVQDNIPSYHDDNVKLCLLNDKGEISFTEQEKGQYHIRRSGDLYSILSLDNKELVNYSLSYVFFLSESTAIIKNTEGDSGFFIDEKCILIAGCKHIELLSEDLFKFENNDGIWALGDCSGPICDFDYCDIKAIDTCHFIASPKHRWGNYPSGDYVIIDKSGKPISSYFSSISDFINGYANAIYQGRKGVIDVTGNMQEKIVMNYEDYTLCEKFETYYFRNKDAEVVSEVFQKVNHLIGMFFIVMRQGEVDVRLFSIEMNKVSDNSYSNITHLVGNLFVAQIPKPAYSYSYSGSNNVYQLYKGIEKLYSYFSSVSLLDNGYIALERSSENRYNYVQKKFILAKPDGTILNDREYDSITVANENSFKVYINGNEGSIDLEGNPIVEKIACENNYVLTHCFADYGLEDPEGNVIISLEEHISSIVITEDPVLIVCRNDKYALYSINGVQITEHKFSTITYKTNNCYAVVEGKIKGHIDSLGNYIESSAESITDDGITIFVIMEKYGLRYTNGEIIIPAEYTSIKILKEKLLAVSKGSQVALFDIEGKALTEFKYSDISCREDGSILATRNKTIGGLDDQGKEIAEIIHFNGGYLKSSFGDYSIMSDAEEIIVPIGYSNIELLDNDGIFALWKGTKVAICKTSKDKTEAIYESAKSIGNNFIVVSRTISKKTRIRHTGYGYRGNPYTYYSTNIVKEKKYGIIDYQLRTIIPCKYASISDFDNEQNLMATNTNGEKKAISLQNLKKKASHTIELSIGMEYEVTVQSFMAIGLIVKFLGNSFIIHRKHLFKEKKNFTKGELLIAKFGGYDLNGHPIWSTKASSKKSEDYSDTINKEGE